MEIKGAMGLDEELARYHDAARSAMRHLALLHLVRCRALSGRIDGETPPSPRPLVVIPRRQEANPVAFLGCFTNPEKDYVLPLKAGVNRVGKDPMWGDHIKPPEGVRLMEGRQWLIISQPAVTLAADDHSTNGSVVLRPDAPEVALARHPFPLSDLLEDGPGRVTLDWDGDTVTELVDGSVLATYYAAFVFGRLPAPRER